MDPLLAYLRSDSEPLLPALHSGAPRAEEAYLRFPQVKLAAPSHLLGGLGDALRARASTRLFSERPLPRDIFSSVLFFVSGNLSLAEGSPLPRRPHPSGGSKYAVETYVVASRIEGIDPGAYHYAWHSHSLERLLPVDFIAVRESLRVTQNFTEGAHAVLLFSFVPGESVQKYGPLAYKLAFLEAGHLGQNAYIVAAALGIGCCAVGLGNSDRLNKLFGFSGDEESFIYAVAFGRLR